ncbi:hypothetical protein ACHAXH_000419, partial [Discostella pseudostelligera]
MLRGGGEDDIVDANEDGSSLGRRRRRKKEKEKELSSSDGVGRGESADDEIISNKSTTVHQVELSDGNHDSAAEANDSTVEIDSLKLSEKVDRKLDGSKKTRRRRRRVQLSSSDATSARIDQAGEEIAATNESDDNDIQPQSLSNSSDSSSERKKGKKRRSRRRRTIASLVDEEVGTEGSLVSASKASRNDHLGNVSDVETSTRSETEVDVTLADGAPEVVASTQLDCVDDASEDMSTLLSIDASIEIPNEEIIPESSGACIEKEEIPIDPLNVIDANISASCDMNVIAPFQREEIVTQSTEIDDALPGHDEGASANVNVMDRQAPSDGDIDSDNNSELDTTKISSIEVDSSIHERMSMPQFAADAEIDVQTPLSISRELVIDSNGEFDVKPDNMDDHDGAPLIENLRSSVPFTPVEVEEKVDIDELEIQLSIDDESNSDDNGIDEVQYDDLSVKSTPEVDDAGAAPLEDIVETDMTSVVSRDGDITAAHVEIENAVIDGASVDGSMSSGKEQDGQRTTYEQIGNAGEELVDEDCITLSIVTWNLGEASPSEKEFSFVKKFRKDSPGIGSDLVLIGAQECEDIKPRRTEGRRSRHLRRMGIMMLGEEYVPLAIHSLGGIQCALYCHRDVLGDIEMISLADVTCGVGNVFHNKGAIGVYLKMKRHDIENEMTKSSRYLFVTGHLAAHVTNVDARNSDFKRIISELEANAPIRFLRPKRNHDGSLAECDGTHLLSSMDHVFFAGDLNYRVDLPREYVERCIIDIQQQRSDAEVGSTEGTNNPNAMLNKLLRRDQLLQTIASGQAFSGF